MSQGSIVAGSAALLVRALVVLVMLGVVLSHALPAQAFPRTTGLAVCPGESFDFKFVGSGWTEAKKQEVREAAADWETVRDWDGSRVADIDEWTSASTRDTVEVRLKTYSGSQTGEMNCVLDNLDLKSTLEGDALEHWARHELGHALELAHTGTTDGFGGSQPETMATCQSSTTTGLNQDDAGSLRFRHGGLSPKGLHANQGFERGTTYWGKSSVSDFYTSTSSPEDGAAALRWRPTSAYGYVYQSMNFADAGGRDIDARTNVRKISSSATTGYIRLEIYVRHGNYGANPDCDYETDADQNVRVGWNGYTLVRTQYHTPTTSYSIVDETTLYTLPSSDAVDVRVRVASSVKYTSTGTYALIEIDTTRARDRG